jgi:hypothetical protein
MESDADDNSVKKSRGKRITATQKKVLVAYIEENRVIVEGKFSSEFTDADRKNVWRKLTQKLNAMKGAVKNWRGWRRVCKLLMPFVCT